MSTTTDGFLVTWDNGQQFPCRDAAEVMDMITAYVLVARLKKRTDSDGTDAAQKKALSNDWRF